MGHHHLVAHFGDEGVAIVVQGFSGQRKGVALDNLHISEGIEGLSDIVQFRAVAVHRHSCVFHDDMSAESLGIPNFVLDKEEIVGMDQRNTLIVGCFAFFLTGKRRKSAKQEKKKNIKEILFHETGKARRRGAKIPRTASEDFKNFSRRGTKKKQRRRVKMKNLATPSWKVVMKGD